MFEPITLEKYSWSLGTTSFRVRDLKYYIKEQLICIKELNDTFPNLKWKDKKQIKQIKYSEILNKNGVFHIRKTLAKDARVKTSSLVELGLITDDREITKVGKTFLELDDLTPKNNLGIPTDSLLFLNQLAKLTTYDSFEVKPLYSTIYFLLELNKITEKQFSNIVPLCKTKEEIKEAIKWIQNGNSDIEYVFNRVLKSNKTKEVKKILDKYKELSDDDILNLFPHGNGKKYKKPILELLRQLKNYNFNATIDEKFNNIKKFNFNSFKKKSLTRTKSYLYGDLKFNEKNKEKIILNFETSFLHKGKLILNLYILYTFNSYLANLEEYRDLNLRYMKLTDIFLVEYEEIKLDVIPEVYFRLVKNKLLEEKNISDLEILQNKVYEGLIKVNDEDLENKIKENYSDFIKTDDIKSDLNKFSEKIRKERIDVLMKERFTPENLINLLRYLKENKLKSLINFGFDCENLPTILEYVVGISWYYISENEGDILSYLNMKLNANLMPVRFASGGASDIVYKYSDGHDVLLEVTMSSNSNQRRMELEPVTRHLGRYMIEVNLNSYAIFIAPYLDPNVLIAFRQYKTAPYYKPGTMEKIDGMKIIPLDLDDLINIIKNNLVYNKLNNMFNIAYESNNLDGYEWYTNEIKSIL